ncbi:FAD/NAD(P)-binding oxidoreductase [Nonomuraea sp. NPDC005650]|uniref:FAD/NAD(P)-binding oxidoreductase n=1 Tax=Nonomuraea sp. NPDC005650 TaxID=3157045 RepID=UPI0033AE9499
MIDTTGVLVVGASAAGLSTVEALRRHGYRDKVTVLGAEPCLPYDRPPLSKQILAGAWEPYRTQLRSPAALAGLDAEFILGDPARNLDLGTHTVCTDQGRVVRARRRGRVRPARRGRARRPRQ